MKLSNEFKTGLFVLICLAALLGLLIKVGNFTFFKKGMMLHSRFHFTGGVRANAPVRLSGVDIGVVRAIRLTNDVADTYAEVDLWIEEGIKVRKDSKATVSTLGMMGEKYVELQVGTSTEFASENDMLESTDPVRLEELIEIGKKVAADVGVMAKDISRVVNHVDETIQENRSKIDNIFSNFEETSENFNDFSQDVKYHPWKVLAKGKEVPKVEMARDREARRLEKSRLRERAANTVAETVEIVTSASSGKPAKLKQNFGHA